MSEFAVKDSGQREQFESGMVRDTAAGKVQYGRVLDGPMFDRWAEHLSKGAVKYPDVAPGVSNWTLAAGPKEMQRFKDSALRHFLQWYRGDVDEDHAAALFFNVNGHEFVQDKVLEPAATSEVVEVVDDKAHAGYVPGRKMGVNR